MAAAFQQVDEEIGAPLLNAPQSPQLQAVELVLVGLLNEIAVRTDLLILVLDDRHLVTEAAILQVMGILLDHQPHQLHLVLTQREEPDLPFARLRAGSNPYTSRRTSVTPGVLASFAILQAESEDKEPTLELQLIVLNHPASFQETPKRANRIRAELEGLLN